MRSTISNEKIQGLVELLEQEIESYEMLWSLASRQGELMREHDLEGLAENTSLWEEVLPQVGRAREHQDKFVGEMLKGTGVITSTPDLDQLQQHCEPEVWRQLSRARDKRREMAHGLARQNEINGRLAHFCLDLLEGEAAVFRRGLQDAAGDCYDGQGERRENCAGGVVLHRA